MARGKGHRKSTGPKKPPLTHFLCLPLVTSASKPQLEESLKAFRDDVSPPTLATMETTTDPDERDATRPTIHPKAIRPVGALHCTLGVMSLDSDRLDEAIRFLQTLDTSKLLSPAEPLEIDLRGLVSMHSPQSTSILYAAPSDSTERLYPFCLAVQKVFKDAELLVPDDRQLKLHPTIVNTIYAKGRRHPAKKAPAASSVDSASETGGGSKAESSGHGPNANAPLKIDARGLLERYRDFVWAEGVVLDRIALCEMGAKKQFDDQGKVIAEEYKEVASVPLPI